MPTFSFDAQVTAALFDKTGAIFALGDGSVRFENGARSEVHDGAVLCPVVHPSGEKPTARCEPAQAILTGCCCSMRAYHSQAPP